MLYAAFHLLFSNCYFYIIKEPSRFDVFFPAAGERKRKAEVEIRKAEIDSDALMRNLVGTTCLFVKLIGNGPDIPSWYYNDATIVNFSSLLIQR